MRNEELMKKWAPILEHNALPTISDSHREAVTATLLENTETSIREGSSLGSTGVLSEAVPANHVGAGMGSTAGEVKGYDPVLISLVRRAMPNLVAYDIVGVQPMTGPTGLIFAMKAKYDSQEGDEALFDTITSKSGAAAADAAEAALQPGQGTISGSTGAVSAFENPTGNSTAAAEAQGVGFVAADNTAVANPIAEMAFAIEKVPVTAVSRALKAEYSSELAQDLKAIHGLDAETELANMLSAELLAEINREVVKTIYSAAKTGAETGTAAKGRFNLDVDANGRWSVEKFKGLMFQIEKEANAIAKATRRGKGNIVICSSDVASALQMAGVLDYTPALNSNLNVDDTGNTFAGVLNGRYKVYVDPFAGAEYLVVGYKGSSAFDAGIFYCPYVPLQMVRAVGENSFQSKIGFKTRYGIAQNPLTGQTGSNDNAYYRRVIVSNLL
jgi:hypothetical protein